jgi:serine protease
MAAQVRTVGQGGGFNFSTIQSAINAASDGDTIMVSPGTYTGSIDFLTKNIHLVSTNPADASVREATILAPPMRIDASTNGSLQGFRINGQIAFGYNEFPDVRSFSPLISNNHIVTGSTAIDILVGYQQPAPVPVIENNLIEAQLGVYMFVQAFGGGMEGIIRNNTFIGPGPVGTSSAGIMYRMHQEKPFVSNNIITNFEYGWLITYQSRKAERLERFNYNDVFGNGKNYWVDDGHELFDRTGIQGNVSVNPMFVDPSHGDYHLAAGSPLIDAGWDAGLLTDIDGRARPFDVPFVDHNGAQPEFDMGAYEAVPEPAGVALSLLGVMILSGRRRGRPLRNT